MKASDLKEMVRDKYGQIALQAGSSQGCCSNQQGCCGVDYTIFSENYENLSGYHSDADLGLGCGLPTSYAGLKSGQQVLDLGSGAGNDCFVARAAVGPSGKVTGLDFAPQMLEKARSNARKLGYDNVEFVAGDIEAMPFADQQFDVVISNCVLNLVPDKHKAFSEIMRVLKTGAHFCVSDVVVQGELPGSLRKDAEMYAGCVAGASSLQDYLAMIETSGFRNIRIHTRRMVELPAELRGRTPGPEVSFENAGIFSITISADKT